MLTRDRRGTADSINDQFPGSTLLTPVADPAKAPASDAQRRKGMSVRDLLIS